MDKKMTKILQITAALIFTIGICACSDGELKFDNANLDVSPAAPMIIAFSADPGEVSSGGSTTLTWHVANADHVRITASSAEGSIPFNVETDDMQGSAPASGLTSTTDFTLTASKEDQPIPAEGGSESAGAQTLTNTVELPGPDSEPLTGSGAFTTISQTITVRVIEAGTLEATFEATPQSVAPGAQALLKWNVSPAAGVTVAIAASPEEPIVAYTSCDGEIESILNGQEAEGIPAQGCAIVTPDVTTTYSLHATGPGGAVVDRTQTIQVSSSDLSADIKVGNQDNLAVTSFQSQIRVSWTVSPATALVTVTSEPAATCQPALPVNVASATGYSLCTVTAETTFKIVARLGSAETKDDALVHMSGAANAGLVIAKQWAFVGEHIGLELALTEATRANSGIVQNVLVNGAAIPPEKLQQLKTSGVVSISDVTVTPLGVAVKLVCGAGCDEEYDTVRPVSLSFRRADSGDAGAPAVAGITGLAYDSNIEHSYMGVMLGTWNNDILENAFRILGSSYDISFRVYKDGGALPQVEFGSTIKNLYEMGDIFNDAFFVNGIRTFPVKLAVKPGSPDEIFAGTTGALMRSTDGGSTWSGILALRRFPIDARNYNGTPSHQTCGNNKTQGGVTARIVNDIISLSQICDILPMSDGRVIVATDFGVLVEKNIADTDTIWIGKPGPYNEVPGACPDGFNCYKGIDVDFDQSQQTPADVPAAMSVNALTFGHIVNDLELAGTAVFAAADNGVFKSTDGGLTWQAFGSIAGPVLSLAFDSRDKIYAGTASGLNSSSVSAANWQTVSEFSGPALAIALDPHVAIGQTVIMVGTTDGVKISRNGGTSWSTLNTLAGNRSAVETLTIASKQAADNGSISYGIAIGTVAGSEFSEEFSIRAEPTAGRGSNGGQGRASYQKKRTQSAELSKVQ